MLTISVCNYQARPHTALVSSAEENEEPQRGEDEAEDGDAHHPTQRIRRIHSSGSHQTPRQTTENLDTVQQTPHIRL